LGFVQGGDRGGPKNESPINGGRKKSQTNYGEKIRKVPLEAQPKDVEKKNQRGKGTNGGRGGRGSPGQKNGSRFHKNLRKGGVKSLNINSSNWALMWGVGGGVQN